MVRTSTCITAVQRVLGERAAPPISGDGTPGSAFNTLATGYRTCQPLAEASAADIRVNTQVESIGHLTDRIYLSRSDGSTLSSSPSRSDRVSAAAGYRPVGRGVLDEVKLASSAVVGMRFETTEGLPERSGILIGQDGPTRAKAFTFSSRKWPHIGERGTGAGAFVRASFGTFHDPSLVEAEDRTLIGYALEDLAAVTGFTARPVETFVQRWWGGLPVYGVGHPAKMDAVRRAVDAAPGVAVAGAYLDGVGVPACVEAGRAAAEKIVAELV